VHPYVDATEPRRLRRESLAIYGFECACSRCVRRYQRRARHLMHGFECSNELQRAHGSPPHVYGFSRARAYAAPFRLASSTTASIHMLEMAACQSGCGTGQHVLAVDWPMCARLSPTRSVARCADRVAPRLACLHVPVCARSAAGGPVTFCCARAGDDAGGACWRGTRARAWAYARVRALSRTRALSKSESLQGFPRAPACSAVAARGTHERYDRRALSFDLMVPITVPPRSFSA